jgi:hypothetical protein
MEDHVEMGFSCILAGETGGIPALRDERQKNRECRCNIPTPRAYFYTKSIVRYSQANIKIDFKPHV